MMVGIVDGEDVMMGKGELFIECVEIDAKNSKSAGRIIAFSLMIIEKFEYKKIPVMHMVAINSQGA